MDSKEGATAAASTIPHVGEDSLAAALIKHLQEDSLVVVVVEVLVPRHQEAGVSRIVVASMLHPLPLDKVVALERTNLNLKAGMQQQKKLRPAPMLMSLLWETIQKPPPQQQ